METAAQPEQPELVDIREIARTLNLEPDHAAHVTALALDLFDQTAKLHELGAPERRLLEAAALLHDIGYQRGVNQHHKHSRDIILGLELPGFKPREREMIACIARYHRKAEPNPRHKIYADLSDARQRVVRQLAALLRIADGLDRLHVASARGIRLERKEDLLRIVVEQRRPSPTDIWAAMQKRHLFESEFGQAVEILASISV
jgi:exopolyphosphatase / guanosine-5'-triphosphate,3'-diphosphate pyrophosphatase